MAQSEKTTKALQRQLNASQDQAKEMKGKMQQKLSTTRRRGRNQRHRASNNITSIQQK